jgi:hypothetical protein
MPMSPRVVLIAHGYLSGGAPLAGGWPTEGAEMPAARMAQQVVTGLHGVPSLLAYFAGFWTIFSQNGALQRIGPRGLLLTWHAGDAAARVFTLHRPCRNAPVPVAREGTAQRLNWTRIATTLPPLPGAPEEPPDHFVLLVTQDSALQARVSPRVPLTPDGRVDPRVLVLPPEQWPATMPAARLRLVPCRPKRTPIRRVMADPFRDGWALLPSGPVPQAVIAAFQDGTTGQRWSREGNGFTHTHQRRQSVVQSSLPPALANERGGNPAVDVAALGGQDISHDLIADAALMLLVCAQQIGADMAGVWATGEGLLDMRGVRRMTKREGRLVRTAGHRAEDLDAMAAAIRILSALRVHATAPLAAHRLAAEDVPLIVVHEVQERTRSSGVTMPVAWRYSLGPWAGALSGGREPAALFPRAALAYDPCREQFAKRLARYLTFHFRMDAARGAPLERAIGPLLQECNLSLDRRNPERTRQSLERALDRLRHDGVIAAWRIAEDAPLPARGWLAHWLRRRLVATPPSSVQQRYTRLRDPRRAPHPD